LVSAARSELGKSWAVVTEEESGNVATIPLYQKQNIYSNNIQFWRYFLVNGNIYISVRVRISYCNTEEGTYTKDVSEQGAGENICT
jgi:CRISPR/Cas system CSM-associated protein Csm5 (group 7 of RAMP superfamily)